MPKSCFLKRHSSWAMIAKVSVALSIALPAAQAQFIPIREGEAYLTCFPGVEGAGTGAKIAIKTVGGIVNVRDPAFAPRTANWPAPMRQPVTSAQVGLIFGIAFDYDTKTGPNIYVANSAGFGLHIVDADGTTTIPIGRPGAQWMPGQFGVPLSVVPDKPQGEPAIYKIGPSGNPVRFGTLTNDGPGFGNIAFNPYTPDPAKPVFYVSDLSNGKIYQLNESGVVVASFDHGMTAAGGLVPDANVPVAIIAPTFTSNVQAPPSLPSAQMAWGITQDERLTWAVGVYRLNVPGALPRLYYSVGRGSLAKIFSVGLDPTTGVIDTGDIRTEVDNLTGLTGIDENNYITDIAFSNADRMLVAERGLKGTVLSSFFPTSFTFYTAHVNRVLGFVRNPNPNPLAPTWVPDPAVVGAYDIGVVSGNDSASGGLDFAHGLTGPLNDPPFQTDLKKCDERFLATGDLLQGGIYGLQDSPLAAPPGAVGGPAAVLPFSYFIDADGDTASAKTQIGDVEVYRRSCRAPGAGIIKVCKVAGPGVTLGTRFNFTAPPHSAAARAGPAPGGFCKVLGSDYDILSKVTVTETGPLGYGVTSIRVAPTDRLAPGTINLAAGSVDVKVGPGVTEVTYTNERRTGYIEICKDIVGDPLTITGDFSFTLSPAGPAGAGPFIVPADACTPAIATLGGAITITEARRAGYDMINACSTLPADRQGACNTRRQTSVVSVAAGDLSTQTIAFIQNQSRATRGGGGVGGNAAARAAARAEKRGASATDNPFAASSSAGVDPITPTLTCAPHASAAGPMWLCTAKFAGQTQGASASTGMVAFESGGRTVAILPLKRNGTATLAIPSAQAGSDMNARYGGATASASLALLPGAGRK